MEITVAITTFNEGDYLDRLLGDLSIQNFGKSFEIVLLEAGDYSAQRAQNHLGRHADKLTFHHFPGLSRTKSLNFIFGIAKGDMIVRLDARSHVRPDYLTNIYRLSVKSGAENVGGVMNPVGLTESQMFIAEIMKHPLSFGGAKARKLNFRGLADSVYLGAFRKNSCVYGEEWFDSTHSGISEDSDLNYRIRCNGGKIFVDSAIIVEHYPRETMGRFFRLCFNYGVGRGLFVLKHRLFSAYRQLIPPLAFLSSVLLLLIGLLDPTAFFFLLSLVVLYLLIVLAAAMRISETPKQFLASTIGFIGCHFCWTAGFLCAPIVFFRDIRNAE
jgi:succinoglycan biosynthesis protein ExoA